MSDTLAARLPHTDGTVVEYCQCLPGFLLATGRFEDARAVMTALANAATDGYLFENWSAGGSGSGSGSGSRSGSGTGSGSGRRKKTPDVEASLWFVHAGYSYFMYTRDEITWRQYLLPCMKRIGQGLIGGAFPHVRMGDGGLLEISPTVAGRKRTRAADMGLGAMGLVVNILWDNALAILAEELHRAGDHAGDHFGRLGGRFKRSFLKMYWSERVGCLVVPQASTEGAAPDAKSQNDSGAGRDMPDPRQLLAAVLPFSAVPRTKQRQIVDLIRLRGQSVNGVRIDPTGDEKHGHDAHPLYSPLHLAWLAEGHVRTSDTPATAVAEAQEFLRKLYGILETDPKGIAKLYDAQGPAKTKANSLTHGPTMAEIRRVWLGLQAAAERPIGNSKRTRITGTLMPGGSGGG